MSQNNDKQVHILPVLPLRGLTAFPNMLIHFDVGRLISIKALEQAMKDGQNIFLATQTDFKTDEPKPNQIYEVGTVCSIKQILKLPGDSVRVLVEGKYRAKTLDYITSETCIYANVEELITKDVKISQSKKEALVRTAQEKFAEYIEYVPKISPDVIFSVASGSEPYYIADFIAQNIAISYEKKQRILEELDSVKRINAVIKILCNEINILTIEAELHEKFKSQIDKNQREYYLREQLKVIQSELGENDSISDVEEYNKKLNEIILPEDYDKKIKREIDRLSKMSSSSAEANVIRMYLDTIFSMPWNKTTKDNLDLKNAQKQLDRDHYGLGEVKDRILEFLSVRSIAKDIKGQIICLVGPPGVGKTSIALSIAKAMGKKYARVSLGGVRDEAEIRGHRKTYVGAMPGSIINAVIQAKSKNAMILLDEIDKMGNDFRGDPASAMLEVLDPAQNSTFKDHYIEVPFDLSEIIFITTANSVSTIPRPLLDRMEIIHLSSYTDLEKFNIAKKHLLVKQMEKHGLTKTMMSVTDGALNTILQDYTRESGVRRLEQVLAKLCRRVTKKLVDNGMQKVSISDRDLHSILGHAPYKRDKISKSDMIGVVNGLAYTSVGGEMLQVEVNVLDGSGKTEITGNLGNVMQESVKAAISYVRSKVQDFDIDPMFYKNKDIYIHFPEAATPKDGPSAGITITTAIISALTSAPVRGDVAMTGEVSIRGRVLPIGGLKEKTMAAYRAGINTVIIPKDNEHDIEELDKGIRDGIDFIIAENMQVVINSAIDFSSRIFKSPVVENDKSEVKMPITSDNNKVSADIRQ